MTQRHAWIDASAGVAGDMLLGALVDAGADLDAIQAAVELVIPGAVRFTSATVDRAGLRACKVDVEVLVDDPPHRTWASIAGMLTAAALPDQVRRNALAVFGRLADAEGHVHGVPAADVHFHEVGALDSIADVVGVCAALDQLAVTAISVGTVAVGGGRVRAAHGSIPVPVPAVARLALGFRITAGGDGELATPTGMALVTTLATHSAELPAMVVQAVGSGAGTKDPVGRPNVTRIIVGQQESGQVDAAAMVLEANIDDLDPRLWPGVLARLMESGADDAWLTPILMKKGRPAHTVSVLCTPGAADRLRELIFTETSTLGIRTHPTEKAVLSRGFVDLELSGDRLAIKVGHRDGLIVQVTPEFEDVAAAARRRELPQRVLLDQANAAAVAAGLVEGAPVPVLRR